MMEIRVFILFVFLAVVVYGGRVYRIVGGMDASEGEFPYQVKLLQNGHYICGGSIISKDFVLTAAHCIESSPQKYKIIAGTRKLISSKGQLKEVEKIYMHEKWSLATFHNDIALLKLSAPLELNDNVKPISLPTEDIAEGSELVLSGWGDTSTPGDSPQILQKSISKVSNFKQCNNTYKNNKGKVYLKETQFCAFSRKHVGACKGDSGGPLVLKNKYIVGIASRVIDGCAFGKPDVFTRVYKYVDWIQKHMNKA